MVTNWTGGFDGTLKFRLNLGKVGCNFFRYGDPIIY